MSPAVSLPWVSRAALDRAINAMSDATQRAILAEARLNAILETVRTERERYDTLFYAFNRLRAAGATLEPKVTEAVPLTQLQPDPLATLIDEVAGSDYRKRAMMLRQLSADRAARRSPEDIERDIVQGYQSDGVPA